MFKKILIANRGEIACRIIKTAKKMGIQTVAVYSDADRDALHVEMADEAINIGFAPAKDSYLKMEAIINACKATGAQAVHPGYGFLSERAAFAQALLDNAITFIGPNPGAIAAMGDKIQSKKFAHAAGVSTVPGFLGEIADGDHAVSIAEEIGYPVMIKASAGGGGKGMRVAFHAGEVKEGFVRAKSEALSSFGDDRVFLEKFILNPRHIEIQIMGDKHGNVIYLGERECSIQRRNQKVVEEAPSPLLDPATRARMGAQAVALAKAVAYDSAGTVEFVAGQDKSFYFLEMNTRLQVEHPVTEMVTGVDVVELMLRVAAGEVLPLGQSDVRLTGWAVESRIYAEDPTRNFLPSIGRLKTFRPPAEHAEGQARVRVDTGVYEGAEVSIHYDPMLAKLITHAPTRLEAIAAQARALDAFVVAGISHNIPFLSALMGHQRWQAGDLSTGFLGEEFPDGFKLQEAEGEKAAPVLLAAAAMAMVVKNRGGAAFGPHQAKHRLSVWLGRRREDVTISLLNGTLEEGLLITRGNGQSHEVYVTWHPGLPLARVIIDNISFSLQVETTTGGHILSFAGTRTLTKTMRPRDADLAALIPPREMTALSKALLCPMPGLLRSLSVRAGQEVRAGEALAIVEAMKMENILRAERDGTVAVLKANVGDVLSVDAVILEFA